MLTADFNSTMRANGFAQNSAGEWVKVSSRPLASAPTPTPSKRIRQDGKPLMNKLETEFFLRLQQDAGDIKFIRPQSIRFMLGNGIWYKPDFTGFIDGSFSAWEVKGPHAFRGGFENLKVAAHQYAEVHWYLVWKKDGQWQQQRILP